MEISNLNIPEWLPEFIPVSVGRSRAAGCGGAGLTRAFLSPV